MMALWCPSSVSNAIWAISASDFPMNIWQAAANISLFWPWIFTWGKKKTQVNVISLRHCYESSIMLPVWPVLQTDVYFTMKKIVYNLYNLRPSKSFLSSVEFMWHVKHKQCSPTNLWVLLYCEKEILSSDATDNMACSTASTFYGSRWGCDTCFADIVFQLLWMKLFLQYEILEFNLPGFQKKKYCNFNHFKINF